MYVCGFMDRERCHNHTAFSAVLPQRDLAIPPAYVLNPDSMVFEGLVASRVAKTEDEWIDLIHRRVDGLRVHTCELLLGVNEHSLGCAERLIEQYIKLNTQNEIPEQFLDAYRLMSGGLMHRCDKRHWVMNASATDKMANHLLALHKTLTQKTHMHFGIMRRLFALDAQVSVGFTFGLSEYEIDQEANELQAQLCSLSVDISALEKEIHDLKVLLTRQQVYKQRASKPTRSVVVV